MPQYVQLARATLEATDDATQRGLKVVVYATPRGYMCSAETDKANTAWLNTLLATLRTQDMTGNKANYVLAVSVPSTAPPLDTLADFQAMLPEELNQRLVSLAFTFSDTPDDTNAEGRVIIADFITEASIDEPQFEFAADGRFVLLSHGRNPSPSNPEEFWRAYAAAIEQAGNRLCERVINLGGGDVIVVMTRAAAHNPQLSLLSILSPYPS